jgi:peptidyl-prolyl cis-trans isomerase C
MIYPRLIRSFQVILAFVFVFSSSSCHESNHSEEKYVITVGTRKITKAELEKDFEDMANEMGVSGQELKKGVRPIINKIVEKYLIMEYGNEMGIKISDEELAASIKELTKDYPKDVFEEILLENSIDYESWKEDLHKKLLIEKITKKAIEDASPITFNEAQAYYNSHLEEFRHPLMVRLRQIVVHTGDEAEKIMKRLAQGEDMGELARKYSITPDAQDGGVMGWVSKGQLEETIEGIIFSLGKGKRSDILKSPYGWHIFEVMDIRDEGYKSLPEAMKEIETMLASQKTEMSYSKWITSLKDRYPVKIEEEVYSYWNKEGKTS